MGCFFSKKGKYALTQDNFEQCENEILKLSGLPDD